VDFIDPLDVTGFVSLDTVRMVSATAGAVAAVVPVGGTLSKLNVHLVKVTGSVTVTVFVNGAATTLTCTVLAASSTCADGVSTKVVAASDTIAVRIENTNGAVITNFSWTAWLAP
jgi:hypothetical protein